MPGTRAATRIIPTQEVTEFSDGEVLDRQARRGQRAPGNTDGSAAIRLEDRGVRFTGDVLYAGTTPAPGRSGPHHVNVFTPFTPVAIEKLAR